MLHRAQLRLGHVARRLCVLAGILTVACSDTETGSDFGAYGGAAVEGPYTEGASAASGGDGESDGGPTARVDGGSTGVTESSTTGGGAAGTSSGATGATAKAGTLKFTVLTKPTGGKYAPRNVGAIWVETAAGKWVKTLAVWAGTRERYLTRYVTASARNRVDAVASATQSSHTTHSVTWNSTDANRKVVPDGEYRIVMEVTDKNSAGDSFVVPFTKATTAVKAAPADQAHFVGMSLAYQ